MQCAEMLREQTLISWAKKSKFSNQSYAKRMNRAFMFRTKKIDYAKIKLSRDKRIDFKGFFGDSGKEMRDMKKEKRKLCGVDDNVNLQG